MASSTWFEEHQHNITSQNGEDGILLKILEILDGPEDENWCVEFGAWDGKFLSNSYNLVTHHGYSAVMIEGNPRRVVDLRKTFETRDDVIPLCNLVGFEADDNLDVILRKTAVPDNFALLSIDIDGNDYHVWEATTEYRPKVVVVEFNPTVPNEIEFVQPRDMSVSQGSSLLSLTKLARRKGYELVAVTDCNGIFVDSEYFRLFEVEDNSPAAMRPANSYQTYAFIGFDGTLFIRGNRSLVWHGLEFEEADIQPLPRILRRNRDRYNKLQSFLFRCYKRLRGRRAA